MPARRRNQRKQFVRTHWLAYRRRMRRWWRRKRPHPLCFVCGYNLRGRLGAAACPECGESPRWRAAWQRDGKWPIGRVLLITGTLGVAGLLPLLAIGVYDNIRLGLWTPTPASPRPPQNGGNSLIESAMFPGAMLTMGAALLGEWLVQRRTRRWESAVLRAEAYLLLYLCVMACALAMVFAAFEASSVWLDVQLQKQAGWNAHMP